jgi:hypothetical protein
MTIYLNELINILKRQGISAKKERLMQGMFGGVNKVNDYCYEA